MGTVPGHGHYLSMHSSPFCFPFPNALAHLFVLVPFGLEETETTATQASTTSKGGSQAMFLGTGTGLNWVLSVPMPFLHE